MQKHVKNYMKYFDYGCDDVILCEVCHACAVDLHHITYRSRGGSDEVDNIIALCRVCHNKAHDKIYSSEFLQSIHNKKLDS